MTLPQIHFQYRISLILHFAVLNIKIRFKNTFLGIAWAAFEPLMYFVVLYIVFSGIRETGNDFAIYLITGVMLYHIFARGTSGGLVSLTSNSGIMKSVFIRREFFPIVATVAIGILSFVDVAVFFGLMPLFHFVPGWTIILLPIPIFLILVLILGLSYFLSVVNVFVRDIQNIWHVLTQALLFISPIFWKVSESGGILLQIHKINPIGQLIDITHKLVSEQEVPPLADWLYASFLVAVVYIVGYLVFRRLQEKIVEEL